MVHVTMFQETDLGYESNALRRWLSPKSLMPIYMYYNSHLVKSRAVGSGELKGCRPEVESLCIFFKPNRIMVSKSKH